MLKINLKNGANTEGVLKLSKSNKNILGAEKRVLNTLVLEETRTLNRITKDSECSSELKDAWAIYQAITKELKNGGLAGDSLSRELIKFVNLKIEDLKKENKVDVIKVLSILRDNGKQLLQDYITVVYLIDTEEMEDKRVFRYYRHELLGATLVTSKIIDLIVIDTKQDKIKTCEFVNAKDSKSAKEYEVLKFLINNFREEKTKHKDFNDFLESEKLNFEGKYSDAIKRRLEMMKYI